MQPLQAFGEDIWIVDGDRARLFGIPFTTRMTLVRLASGELWVHSPVEPYHERVAALRALAPLGHLIAPNKIHSLNLKSFAQRFPEASVWLSPRFNERHPQLHFGPTRTKLLTNAAPEPWRDQIDQTVFDGSKFLDEVVFFHRRSRTLIVTDLIQRHDPQRDSWFWRLAKRAVGVLGEQGGTARDLRLTFTDRTAARRSAQNVMAWDFDRLIVSHGLCIQQGARPAVERALESWLGPI